MGRGALPPLMLAPGIREGLLDKLDALGREPARVPGEAVLDILVDLFMAAGEGMRPAARDGCLDLATLVMGQVAPEKRREALERLAESPAIPTARLLAWARGRSRWRRRCSGAQRVFPARICSVSSCRRAPS